MPSSFRCNVSCSVLFTCPKYAFFCFAVICLALFHFLVLCKTLINLCVVLEKSLSEVVIVRWTQRDYWRNRIFPILFQEHFKLSFHLQPL